MNIRICQHCGNKFDIAIHPKGWMANHSRWCDSNPKRNQYNNTAALAAMATAREKSGHTNQYTKAKVVGSDIPVSPNKGQPGKFAGRKHFDYTKKIIQQKALSSKHRRLRRKMVEYKGIMLDSTWELELAKRLDYIEVKWIRPSPIEWIDQKGMCHNYFPDFFLPEFDLYLDPKNKYAQDVQKEKIAIITKQLTNLVILSSMKEIKEFTPKHGPVD